MRHAYASSRSPASDGHAAVASQLGAVNARDAAAKWANPAKPDVSRPVPVSQVAAALGLRRPAASTVAATYGLARR